MIGGKTMIDRVYDECIMVGGEVAVVTDDDRIEQHLKKNNKKVVRINDIVETGSERIALAFERHFKNTGFKTIINVQGDEPLIKSETLKELNRFHQTQDFEISTLVKKNDDKEKYNNPNTVKALWSEKTRECLSFSRAPIPFYRNSEQEILFWQHVGVYCYSPESLTHFNSLPVSYLERCESLEQLRALENGMKIGAILTDLNLHGVDTPDDIKKIEEMLT